MHCNLKSSDIAPVGVAESNGDIRILIGSWRQAVCAHAQYKIDQQLAENDWRIRNCHIS